jgi:hypothetical protein
LNIEAKDIPDLLPEFFTARCLADPFYDDVVIIVVDPGDKEAELLKKFATLMGKGDKRGVALLLLPVDNAEDDLENKGNGPLKLTIVFQVWENRQINKSIQGTGKSGYKVARHTFALFKHYAVQGLCKLLVPDKPAIQRVAPPEGEDKKLRGWGISFIAREDDVYVTPKTGLPAFTPRTGATATVAIACPTDGAEIYFTKDGTPPVKDNAGAELYTGPIAVPAEGFTLFACAYVEGHYPSDTISSTFTAP